MDFTISSTTSTNSSIVLASAELTGPFPPKPYSQIGWKYPNSLFQFSLQYLIIVAIAWLFGLLSFIHILRYEKFKYGMLCNPIFIFTPFYLALFIIMRIGALESFEPSFLRNSSGIIGSSYMDIVGYFPELLIILELGLCLLIDMIFFRCVNKSIDEFVKIRTHSSELKLDEWHHIFSSYFPNSS